MRTRSPQSGTAARILLCALPALTSGCSFVNETLVQALSMIWLVVSVLLAGLIVGGLRWLAWSEALKAWEHPDPPKPVTKAWTPILIVVVVFGVFALYNFSLNPLPSSPEQQWWNAGMWFLGSLIGALAGWFVGREGARRWFERAYPGQSKVNRIELKNTRNGVRF
ncbi:MAG: hypothetical protein OXU64_02505 [Gemmatimonadota bacterium]|nr:hypothetical protein [Gemmatimonadota bacterium]